MSYTPSKSEDLPNSFDRRRHVRQRIGSLCPVWSGVDNGGIVLDISEGGLGIQAVGTIADDALLQMRVGLPSPGSPFVVEGQVVWTSESRKQAGVVFVGLAEQTRDGIREWILKQKPSDGFASGAVRSSNKENRVVSMPRSEGSETHAGPVGRVNKLGLDIEAMFPSEKAPVAPRVVNVPVRPPRYCEQPPRESATPMKEWLANIERGAEAAKAKLGEIASPAAPETSQPVIAPTPDPEKIAAAPSQEEVAKEQCPPLTLASDPSVLLSEPSTWATQITPPVVQTDHDSSLPLTGGWQTEPTSTTADLESYIAPQLTAPGDGPTRTETNRTVVSFPASREVAAQSDPLPPSDDKSSVSQTVSLPQADISEVLPKSTSRLSEEDVIAGLRAAMERRNIAKSVARDILTHHPAEEPPDAIPAALGPVETVEAASAASRSAAASGAVLAEPAPEAVAGVTLGHPQAGEFAREGSSEPDISNHRVAVQREPRRVPSKSFWMPRPRFEQAAAAVLLVAFVVGIAFVWRKVTPGSDGHSAIASDLTTQPAPQKIEPLAKPDEFDKAGSGASDRERLERPPAVTAPSATARQKEPGLTSAGSNDTQEKSGPLSPVPATNEAIEVKPPQEKTALAAIEPQSSKISNSGTSNVSTDNGGGEKPSNDSSTTPATPIAPQTPSATTAATSLMASAGDRVLPSSLLYSVQPLYPPDAAQKHIEGTVKLAAVIGKDGRVMGLGVISGPTALVPAALSAAREWRYVPALLNGEPVETQTDITIEFHLPADVNP
jgi:TonB family protein